MSHAEEPGARITALASQIYAAEHRLLALIREFDEHQYRRNSEPDHDNLMIVSRF